MDNLFMLEPEKYWDFTSKYSKEDKKREINNRILSNEYIASIKKDGDYSRPTMFNGEFRLLTRSLSKVTGEYGRKEEHVPHISKVLKKVLPDNTVLIGELFYPNKTSQDVATILRCKAPKAAERQETKEYGKLKLYLHDIWFLNGEDLRNKPYNERITILTDFYQEKIIFSEDIILAKHAIDSYAIFEMMEKAFENNEEGIVMVRKNATVNHGKRTAWKTIKVKKELEEEVDCFFTGRFKEPTMIYNGDEILDWKYWINKRTMTPMAEGNWYEEYSTNTEALMPVTKGYYYNWAGSLEIGILKEGKVEILGYISGISDEIKEDYAKNPKDWTLKPITVTAMQFTKDNKLRHPRFVRFREDINVEDCTYEKIFG